MAPLSKPVELEPQDVQWLYRQGGLLLGPVATAQLVARLYKGEVTARTEVSPLGSNEFLRLGELDAFRLHLAKAEAKLRVEAAAREEDVRKSKHRRLRLGIFISLGVVFSLGAAYTARYLAVHRPWAEPDPLADLDFQVAAPKIEVARASRAGAEELLDYPGMRTGDRNATRRPRPGSPAGPGGPVPGRTVTEADGMEIAQFDQGAINGVVAKNQPTLKTCFVEEARRTPGFAAQIPIEFVIGNDGKVAKLWVDHPEYKSGPLADCLLRELQKWPFRPYDGARATVGLSFRIGKSS